MKRRQPKIFSWRLKLLLVLGCLGGVALALFNLQVASMPAAPLGAAPLSSQDKPSSGRVVDASVTGAVLHDNNQLTDSILPAIDQSPPAATEHALFALG